MHDEKAGSVAGHDTKEHPAPPVPAAGKPGDAPGLVPGATDLTRSERPGGALDMPASSRATDLRDESNDERDSNTLGSGVST